MVAVDVTVHLVGADLHVAVDALGAGDVEEHLRADDVGLHERLGRHDAAVDVRLGGEVHDLAHAVLGPRRLEQVLVGDVVSDIMDTCLQFHGGWGYIEDFPIARAWRDQRLFRIGGGTTETMKYYIAKLMGF